MARMIDWYEHWNSKPASLADHDVLRQVGKTVGGQPISAAALDVIISDILAALRLDAHDSVLDLCCGNGVITARCALYCLEVTGVDFSAPLIRIANDRCSGTNVNYVLADVRSLPSSLTDRRYSKILMYEAIQHLSTRDAEILLDNLRKSKAHAAPVLFGSIPDRDRIWNFYDTEDRRKEYFRRAQDGSEAIGHWWTKGEISDLGRRCGYRVAILRQNPALHTSHYRFDGLLMPNDPNG